MKIPITIAASRCYGRWPPAPPWIRILSTQAIEGYRELVPQFEKASGHTVMTVFTGTLDAQKRIAAGETYDLIIMAGPAIDESETPLIYSGVIEDPVYLAKPVEWSGHWQYRPNMPHSNQKCDVAVARRFLKDS
jgi:hypothetical protein